MTVKQNKVVVTGGFMHISVHEACQSFFVTMKVNIQGFLGSESFQGCATHLWLT